MSEIVKEKPIINSKLNKNILDNVDKLIENLKKLFKMRN